MQTKSNLFRLSAALAVGGLLFVPGAMPLAQAQTEATGTAQADPPGRVGWLSQIAGTVSTRTTQDTDWSAATANLPVTSGDAYWTEPAASAGLDIGATHLAMDQSREFDVDTLDDTTLAATDAQGSVFLNVTTVQPGETYQITTPRGVVTIAQPGHYEIVSGDTTNPTLVTVVDGNASVQATGVAATLTVQAHQTAQLTGSDTFQASVGAEQDDAFLTAQLAPAPAPPPPPASSAPPPPVVAQMTGGSVLMTTGDWQTTPQYGNVWYPPVQAGWAPYRHGHWGYVRPWGWTWIDDASWGFAPFHYGRWVQVGPRWGWIAAQPGIAVSVRPVYAPALVAFIGGVTIGAAVGGSVGWIPLGPREVYRPPYHVSNTYIRNVNVTNVTNVTTINTTTINNTTINNYANRGAATVVPSTTMTSSQPVAQAARPVTPQQLAAARPVAAEPVKPTATTAGVTPAVARQLKLPPAPPAAAKAKPAAPGPAVQPHPKGAAVPLRPASPIKPAVAQPGRPAAERRRPPP